jgi:hypothetical protein
MENKKTKKQPLKVRKRGDAHAHTHTERERDKEIIFFSRFWCPRVFVVRCSLFVCGLLIIHPRKE